jgi:hypothetical protein
MAKESKPDEKQDGKEKTGEENIFAAADTKPAKLSEREIFRQFMLAVAGRDDANYKTAPKIADDAAALTGEYLKRAGAFKA